MPRDERATPVWRSKLRRLRALRAWTRLQRASGGEPGGLPAISLPRKRGWACREKEECEGRDAALSAEHTIKKACTAERDAAASWEDGASGKCVGVAEASPKKRTRSCSALDPPGMQECSEEAADAVPRSSISSPTPSKRRVCYAKDRTEGQSSALALTVRPFAPKLLGWKPPALPLQPPPRPQQQTQSPSEDARQPQLDAGAEIERILAAEEPWEVLGVPAGAGEEVAASAWKRLMLVLHPDKLRSIEGANELGAEALNRVHAAREDLRRRQQEVCAEVPEEPTAAGPPRCPCAVSGERKYELSWKVPESSDPQRPIERYEIWGPKYFSDGGEPFDWVLLATVPPLQNFFVFVEEAPTQQDVMWAADRVLRATLPIAVHACNGKGSSEALTFDLPWAAAFPWLRGSPSVLCQQCFRLCCKRGPWTKCGGCWGSVPAAAEVVVRCTECQGEVLWDQRGIDLGCTCCFRKLGTARPAPQRRSEQTTRGPPQRQHFRPTPPQHPPPQKRARGSAQGDWESRGNKRAPWVTRGGH